MSPHHDVSIRLPAWFTSDGLSMTLEQLQDPEYVFHVFLPELVAFFSANPGELEIRVEGGVWRRVGGPIDDLPDIDGSPRATWRPNLTADELLQLPAEHADVEPGSVRHGTSLTDVVASQAPWQSWLEAAVRAGYVPSQDGIELAQEAQFRWARARVHEDVEAGVLGDALGWLRIAQDYRTFAQRLLAEAQTLDAWAAELGQGKGRS